LVPTVAGYRTVSGGVCTATPCSEPIVYDPTTGAYQTVPGLPTTIHGFRLRDGRASYGLGLETFALGFPIHFDWSWRTLFNRSWEDVQFNGLNGCSSAVPGACSAEFRKPRFAVWIGYDF
jgi:hypothetical protein